MELLLKLLPKSRTILVWRISWFSRRVYIQNRTIATTLSRLFMIKPLFIANLIRHESKAIDFLTTIQWRASPASIARSKWMQLVTQAQAESCPDTLVRVHSRHLHLASETDTAQSKHRHLLAYLHKITTCETEILQRHGTMRNTWLWRAHRDSSRVFILAVIRPRHTQGVHAANARSLPFPTILSIIQWFSALNHPSYRRRLSVARSWAVITLAL